MSSRTTAGARVCAALVAGLSACELREVPKDDPALMAAIAAADANPTDPAKAFAVAESFYRAGRFFEAADRLLVASKLAPGDPRVYVLQADTYRHLGYARESFGRLDACLQAVPDDPECLYGEALLLRTEGSPRALIEARRAFQRIVATSPEHPRAKLAEVEIKQIEGVLRKNGQDLAALDRPQHFGVPTSTATSAVGGLNEFGQALRRAMAALGRGDFVLAERAAEEAVAMRGEDPTALCALAEVQFRAGKLEPATATIEKAFRIAPEDPTARWLFGTIMIKTGKDLGRGLKAWRDLVEADPTFAREMGVTQTLEQVDRMMKAQ